MASRLSKSMEDVRLRHSLVLSSDIKAAVDGSADETSASRIRDHPRWKELIGDDGLDRRSADVEEEGIVREAFNEDDSLEGSMGPAFIPAETTVRNDYSQHFVDTQAGQLPGNAVCNPYKSSRFEEYPKLRRLIQIKSEILVSTSHPPIYLQTNLLSSTCALTNDSFHLAKLLPIKFDVVIIDPPLESYEWESVPSGGKTSSQVWSWDQVAALPIPHIMAKESFIFLWVGSGASDGLERGREVLMRWGYRRCEDIVWVQTNSQADDNVDKASFIPGTSSSCFAKSAQHCLMGIRGTVRRSTDTRFVHCNIDTDVILWPGEQDQTGSRSVIDTRSKPPELMDLAENFCLGTRRLELFGRNRNLRRGWLTIGLDVGPQATRWKEVQQGNNACAAVAAPQRTPLAYDKSIYDAHFGVDRAGCALAERINLVPYYEEVEILRPRSPSHSNAGDRRGMQPARSPGSPHQYDPINNLAMAMQYSSNLTHHAGGAGISGLGAGGPAVVSVPSGSEMLSGAQANVLMGQASMLNAARSQYLPPGLSKSRKPYAMPFDSSTVL